MTTSDLPLVAEFQDDEQAAAWANDPAAAPARSARVLRDRPFALRLQKACDQNPRVPAYNRGRQAWVRRQLIERFGVSVSVETVSKWFTGVARPRPDKIGSLARLLGADETWLAGDASPDAHWPEFKVRNAVAHGAVNVLAGFIQMCGGHVSAPDRKRPTAPGEATADLHATIDGMNYAFHVAVGQVLEGGAYRFALPRDYRQLVVIGVIQREPLCCDFLHLRTDLVEAVGRDEDEAVEVTLSAGPQGYVSADLIWPRITSFANGV